VAKLKDFYDSQKKIGRINLEFLDFFKDVKYKEITDVKFVFSRLIKNYVDEIDESDIKIILPKLTDKKVIFKDVKFNFDDVLFNKNCFFENLDLTKTNFNNSYIKELNFRNCFFGSESRIILNNERGEISEKTLLNLEES